MSSYPQGGFTATSVIAESCTSCQKKLSRSAQEKRPLRLCRDRYSDGSLHTLPDRLN